MPLVAANYLDYPSPPKLKRRKRNLCAPRPLRRDNPLVFQILQLEGMRGRFASDEQWCEQMIELLTAYHGEAYTGPPLPPGDGLSLTRVHDRRQRACVLAARAAAGKALWGPGDVDEERLARRVGRVAKLMGGE